MSVLHLRLPVNSVSYRRSLTGQQRSATRCFSASGFIKTTGLLTGIVDVSSVKDYSREINLDDAANLLKDHSHMYNIALAEAQGNATECQNKMTDIIKKAGIFMANRDEVWDRDELKGALLEITAGLGKFGCLLGGKSTGNSLVLRWLKNNNMGTVFVVDCRSTGHDIVRGLRAVLEKRRDYYLDLEKQQPVTAALKDGQVVTGFLGKGKSYDEFLKAFHAKQSFSILFDEIIRVEGEKITNIIDEANIAFNIKPYKDESDIQAAKRALAMFTLLTKESNKV